MVFTTEDELYHSANSICCICDKQGINEVREHCHKTGKHRGPAFKICNLNCKDQIFIPN